MRLGAWVMTGAWMAVPVGAAMLGSASGPEVAAPAGPVAGMVAVAELPGTGAATLNWTPSPHEDPADPPYNGQFTYVRIRFGDSGADLRDFGGRGWGRRSRDPPWHHDYPRAEVNFSKIVNATTFIDNYMEGNAGRILTLDDPELFRYPIATIIEPGYWQPSQEEVEALGAWLLKGGFLIADDFRGNWEIDNLQRQLLRALPDHFIQVVPDDHEIFNSFFYIEDPHALVHPYQGVYPQYLGVFEDNDPVNGRIMVMINWNQDLQEYWEFSDRGYYPIDLSNEAYQFGVNYLVYAMTH